MIVKPYHLPHLSQISYLVGDEESRIAAIIDPRRDIEEYMTDLRGQGLTLRYIFLTHFHADFVAGHLELHHQTGADIYLGARARSNFPFHAVGHGDEIECGAVRFTVLETPGHTPEGICLVMYDQEQNPDVPQAIFTGNTLLIGGVGRTDLFRAFGVTSSTLAAQLYDSLHLHLLTFPPRTTIYPAHGHGTLCAGHLHHRSHSTIAEEQEGNSAIKPMSKHTFIDLMSEEPLEKPKYFSHVAFLNRRDRPLLDQVLTQATRALTLDDVLHEKSGGTQILDVRAAEDYSRGHLSGSINIGHSGTLERWAGTLLNPDRPIVFIADPGQERDIAIRLAYVGLDNTLGYLDGGAASLASTPELTQSTPRLSVAHLQEQFNGSEYPYLLDVRSAQEWRTRHIDDSQNVPLGDLPMRLSHIPTTRPVIVYCSNGYRSSIATSLLHHYQFSNVVELTGGFDAWEATVINPSLHSSSSLQETHRPSEERPA